MTPRRVYVLTDGCVDLAQRVMTDRQAIDAKARALDGSDYNLTWKLKASGEGQ